MDTLGVYAKANASSWVILSLSDGTNTVDCWFNLAAGTTGTHTIGGSGGGFTLSFVRIPTQTSRRFRSIPAGDSDGSQPLIPTHSSHP
jgi:hypothetical protein